MCSIALQTEKHEPPVICVGSGSSRNLFVQAGAGGEVHLHSLLRSEPLLSVRVSHSSIFQVRWSPARPLVFAAATGTGRFKKKI